MSSMFPEREFQKLGLHDDSDDESSVGGRLPLSDRPGVTGTSSSSSRPSGTSPSVFSTSSSVLSGVTGGENGGNGKVILASEEVTAHENVFNPRMLCCGQVGKQGHRFCCRPALECDVTAHKGPNKCAILEGHFYIKDRSYSARTVPTLSRNLLPRGVTVDELLDKEGDVTVLVTYLESLENVQLKHENDNDNSKNDDSSWEKLGSIPSFEALNEAKANFKTPKKLRMGPLLNAAVENSPAGIEFSMEAMSEVAATNKGDMEALAPQLKVIINDWGRVKSNFEKIGSEMSRLRSGQTSITEAFNATIQELQNAVDTLQLQFQLLRAEGGNGEIDGDVMELFQNEIDKLTKRLDEGNKELRKVSKDGQGTSEFITTLKGELPLLEQRFWTMITSIQGDMVSLQSKIQLQKSELRNITSRLDALPIGLASNVGGKMDPMVVLDEIRTDLDSVKSKIQAMGTGTFNNTDEGARKQIGNLLEKIGELESRVASDSFQVGGYLFTTQGQVKRWLEEHEVKSASMFWDLFSVLVTMSQKALSGKEKADETFSAQRTATTVLENELAASMTHLRPPCLFGKGGIESDSRGLVKFGDGFGAALSTYAEWATAAEPVKSELTKTLCDFCDSVLGLFMPEDGGYDFMRLLMSEIRTQWSELVTFVDNFYQELVYRAGFAEKRAWKLVARCIAGMFHEMRQYRAKVAQVYDYKIITGKSALMWATLQCHRVMKDFIKVRFQGHPVIVKEMSMFMLTERVDPMELERLNTRLIQAEAKTRQAVDLAKAIETNYNSMKRTMDNLTNTVNQVKGGAGKAKKRRGNQDADDKQDS